MTTMAGAEIGQSALGELAIQWQQCKRRIKRERLFERIHALALPAARRHYRRLAPWIVRGDFDQSEEDVNRAIWRAAQSYDGRRGNFESLLKVSVRNIARDTQRMLSSGRNRRSHRAVSIARILPIEAAMNAVERGFEDASSASSRKHRRFDRKKQRGKIKVDGPG